MKTKLTEDEMPQPEKKTVTMWQTLLENFSGQVNVLPVLTEIKTTEIKECIKPTTKPEDFPEYKTYKPYGWIKHEVELHD